MNLLVGIAAVSLERAEQEAATQTLRALDRARAELSQVLAIAFDAGDDLSAGVRLEFNLACEPG